MSIGLPMAVYHGDRKGSMMKTNLLQTSLPALDGEEVDALFSDLSVAKSGAVLRKADLAILDVIAEDLCGIDEAGRGPLVGPVSAAAVILPRDFPYEVLNDSKALTPKMRDRAYEIITEKAIAWSIGWSSCDEIGNLNILNASLLAMKRAYATLGVNAGLVLVDGNKAPALRCARIHPVIKGDACVPAIMAASILAKVARDRLMERLDRIEPCYGFSKHKGYPTREHREAIRAHGFSQWARPGFRT